MMHAFALLGRDGDPVVRLIVTHWILGALTGMVCAALLLLVDIAGLRSLLMASDMCWVGILLLLSGFAITFGGVVCASAIMMVPVDGEDPGRPRKCDRHGQDRAQEPDQLMRRICDFTGVPPRATANS
jgi:hypothetical protein